LAGLGDPVGVLRRRRRRAPIARKHGICAGAPVAEWRSGRKRVTMFRCRHAVLFCWLLPAACSSPDPGALSFAPARGAGHPPASSPADAGSKPPATAPPAPPSQPPPPSAQDASASPPSGSADAAVPPQQAPPGTCANPKCGANADGCGCVATTDQGAVIFLGCNDQGCVCGEGQNVDQQFPQPGACDSDTALRDAWLTCQCP
jgi:nucleoid-associated protein YgaU